MLVKLFLYFSTVSVHKINLLQNITWILLVVTGHLSNSSVNIENHSIFNVTTDLAHFSGFLLCRISGFSHNFLFNIIATQKLWSAFFYIRRTIIKVSVSNMNNNKHVQNRKTILIWRFYDWFDSHVEFWWRLIYLRFYFSFMKRDFTLRELTNFLLLPKSPQMNSQNSFLLNDLQLSTLARQT